MMRRREKVGFEIAARDRRAALPLPTASLTVPGRLQPLDTGRSTAVTVLV